MKKKTKTLISIAVMIFMICAVNVSFVKAESKVIKVGYIDYPGFIQKMDDGSYEGYGVEYLNEIAKYNNWTYEFVENTWEQTLKDVRLRKQQKERKTIFFLIILLEASLQLYMPILNLIFIIKI